MTGLPHEAAALFTDFFSGVSLKWNVRAEALYYYVGLPNRLIFTGSYHRMTYRKRWFFLQRCRIVVYTDTEDCIG